MLYFPLSLFTEKQTFPLFIQYGHHDETEVALHTHVDFSELVIVLSGHAIHQIGEEQFYVKKGDVFVVNENTAHCYHEVEKFRICNIMFRLRDLINSQFDITKTPGFHALFIIEPYKVQSEHFKSRLYLSKDDFLSLKYRLDFMVREYESNKIGRETMLQSDFLYVVTVLSRLYENEKGEEKGGIMALAETISYMEQNYAENITVEELAKQSGYSTRHFNRLFKETYHTTPIDYIVNVRIESACRMLQKQDKSICEIALENGFDNPNYFCRVFKKRIGITPSQYRHIF